MLRIGLFLITNMAVMLVFGFILTILGVDAQSMSGLLIFAALFGFGGAFISLMLSKVMALHAVHATVITKPITAEEQWLFNTVDTHARRVGIKRPDIAIYQAADMNAFATGAQRNNSLVAVSTGLLTGMAPEEAEAVIAHEISHIANGDMVTMALLQGVLNTFVIFISRLLAQLISQVMADRGRDISRISYFIIVMILEFLFGILASLIAMWFSRYREYRADAGSARLVGRNKMINALQRLQNSPEPEEEATMAAFWINNGKKNSFSELFLSHPPLDKRIAALRNETYS